MRILVKENSSGTLSLEQYSMDDIVSIFCGLEHLPDQGHGVRDIVEYEKGEWDVTDADNDLTVGYHRYGNTACEKWDDTSEEITAMDVVDNDPTTIVVAEYDGGGTFELHIDLMGHNALRFFGIEK